VAVCVEVKLTVMVAVGVGVFESVVVRVDVAV
jgi:hypothetical protein